MDIPYTLPGYPLPVPPTGMKQDIFEPEDYRGTDRKAAGAPKELLNSYDSLVDYLTRGMETDLAKVRAIFIWLAAQKVVGSPFPKAVKEDTPRAFLKKIKYDRTLFSDFFALLCRKAGVPCVIIEGSSKGAGYEVGQTALTITNRWNAVHVENEWRLVNVPWALVTTDGFVSQENWIKVEEQGTPCREREKASSAVRDDLDEFWFLTDPCDFNCFLHAKEQKWQLMEQPWTAEDFHKMPKFQKDYFLSDWDLISESRSVLTAEGGKVQIQFAHPPSVSRACLQYKLFFSPDLSQATLPEDKQSERYVLEESSLGKKAIKTRLSMEGVYKIQIAGLLDSKVSVLGEFRIDCVNIKHKPPPFPISNVPIGPTEEARQVVEEFSHEEGVVVAEPGEKINIHFKLKDKNDNLKPRLVHSTKKSDELDKYLKYEKKDCDFNVEVTMLKSENADDECALTFDAYTTRVDEKGRKVAKEEAKITNYLLTPDKTLTFEEDKKAIELRNALLQSIDGFNIDILKNSIKRAEEEGVMDCFLEGRSTARLKALNSIQDERYRRLKLALKSGELTDLEKAREAFQEMREENRNDPIIPHVEVVVQLLKVLEDKDDVTRVERALREVQGLGVETGHIEKAISVLLAHYEKVLSEMCRRRSLEDIRAVMLEIDHSCVADRLRLDPMYRRAVKLSDHLQELKEVRQEVGQLSSRDLRVFTETRNKSPHPHVHSLLMAAFILLGEKEADLWAWQAVQNLLERRKESGVMHAMAELDIDILQDDQVRRTKQHTRECRLEVVKMECGYTPALFLRWVLLTLDEWDARRAAQTSSSEISNEGD